MSGTCCMIRLAVRVLNQLAERWLGGETIARDTALGRVDVHSIHEQKDRARSLTLCEAGCEDDSIVIGACPFHRVDVARIRVVHDDRLRDLQLEAVAARQLSTAGAREHEAIGTPEMVLRLLYVVCGDRGLG